MNFGKLRKEEMEQKSIRKQKYQLQQHNHHHRQQQQQYPKMIIMGQSSQKICNSRQDTKDIRGDSLISTTKVLNKERSQHSLKVSHFS